MLSDRTFLSFFLVAVVAGGCENSADDGSGGAGGSVSAASTSSSGGGGSAGGCYEPTPAAGDDSFVAVDGANTRTFEISIPDDPEGGLVTVTLRGIQIFSDVRVKGAGDGSFLSLNFVAPGDDAMEKSDSFVGAPGVTYQLDVEESWVSQLPERSATVELSWAFEPTRDCFEPNDTPAEANGIELDEEVVAYCFAGYTTNDWPTYEDHRDYYRVEIEAAGTLTAQLEPGVDAVSLTLFAADAPDTALTEGFTIDESSVILEHEVEVGSYLLRVEPFASPVYNTFDGDVTSWDMPYTLRATLD